MEVNDGACLELSEEEMSDLIAAVSITNDNTYVFSGSWENWPGNSQQIHAPLVIRAKYNKITPAP